MDQPQNHPNPKENNQPPPPPPPAPLHADVEDDDENVKQLKDCSVLYLSLQDCLIKTDRNWKSCQLEVQALKACHERRQNDERK